MEIDTEIHKYCTYYDQRNLDMLRKIWHGLGNNEEWQSRAENLPTQKYKEQIKLKWDHSPQNAAKGDKN